jgi:[acyl-carrier-protein] S-malonyltransferase
MSLAVVFPGQGSQYVGMDGAAGRAIPAAYWEEVDDALGAPLSRLVMEGPETVLAQTEHTQPAILATSVGLWRAFQERVPGRAILAGAGHSLGEYSALVAAGSLALGDALRLVRLRGQAMQAAVPVGVGAMAAVMGVEPAVLEQLCADQGQGQVLSCSAFNGPSQIVVSGETAAVDRLILAVDELRGIAKKLAVSAPFHCALMEPAARQLAQALRDVPLQLPAWPVYHNSDASVAETTEGIRERLVAQVVEPVRWEGCVLALKAGGATRCVEVGPGKTLAGLIKRIDRSLPTVSLDTANSWGQL